MKNLILLNLISFLEFMYILLIYFQCVQSDSRDGIPKNNDDFEDYMGDLVTCYIENNPGNKL